VEFYASGTDRVAVNDVDDRTLRGLFDLWDLSLTNEVQGDPPLSVTTVRLQREANKFGEKKFFVDKTDRIPTMATLQFARECVRERILAGFRRPLKEASKKERSASAFSGFPIFVTGGGSTERVLWVDIAEQTPVAGSIKELRPLGLVGGVPDGIGQRCVVAAGLAVPCALWPRIFMPSQVEQVPPKLPRDRPDSEELGYEK